ncbi:hypothetical protein MC885_021169 [Smutsia gigantea]|nr:hypothetical protein MC885_021169 [Smutsia gigantea]
MLQNTASAVSKLKGRGALGETPCPSALSPLLVGFLLAAVSKGQCEEGEPALEERQPAQLPPSACGSGILKVKCLKRLMVSLQLFPLNMGVDTYRKTWLHFWKAPAAGSCLFFGAALPAWVEQEDVEPFVRPAASTLPAGNGALEPSPKPSV